LLLLLQIRTQPHLGCCLAAATAAASAIFMHLCTNSATPYTSRQHMRSCNDVNGKSTLPPNHSGSWTRKEKMGFVIHRKVVHSQSCTSLAATRKPNHSLMPAKFHPQALATEAKPSHAKHQRMWNAQSSTQVWMWSRLFTQRRGAKALHVSVLHCSTRMQELLPAAPSPKQNGLSYHVQVRLLHYWIFPKAQLRTSH
jgi:hypothetical protein